MGCRILRLRHEGRNQRTHRRKDPAVDLFNRQISLDGQYAIRFPACNGAVLIEDAAMKVILLALKAIFVRPGLGDCLLVAAAGTGQRALKAGQEQNRQVRLKVVAEQAMQ